MQNTHPAVTTTMRRRCGLIAVADTIGGSFAASLAFSRVESSVTAISVAEDQGLIGAIRVRADDRARHRYRRMWQWSLECIHRREKTHSMANIYTVRSRRTGFFCAAVPAIRSDALTSDKGFASPSPSTPPIPIVCRVSPTPVVSPASGF